ncbi:MAG TPA: hypothetical protein VE825_14890, partial [Terriglobales bacterium]|nr:hypothetical protein [Terriglobales bacterium]
YLLSRRDAYAAPAGQPQSPAEFAQWIGKDRAWMDRAPVLEGYGAVRALVRLPARGQVRYLMGAPGAGHIARFLLVTLAPGVAPQVEQLPVRVLDEDPDAEAAAPQPDFPPDVLPTGPALSFHLRRLDVARGLLLWQVTASRDEQHAVYWVAMDEGGPAAAQALEIATDRAPYYHCGMYRQPAAAYAVRLDPAPFRASLTVEPAVYTDEEDRYTDGDFENAHPRCPGHALVTWKAGRGFVIQDASAECATPELPHRVVIGADGRLTRLAPVVGQDPHTKK